MFDDAIGMRRDGGGNVGGIYEVEIGRIGRLVWGKGG